MYMSSQNYLSVLDIPSQSPNVEYSLGLSVINFNTTLSGWQVIVNTINFVRNISLIVTAIIFVVGAIQLITSLGNKTEFEKGINTIKYAFIGLVAILGLSVIFWSVYTVFDGYINPLQRNK